MRREAAHRQHSRWSFLHYWRLSRGQQRFNRRGGRSGIVVEGSFTVFSAATEELHLEQPLRKLQSTHFAL
uniref:Uncharacterized protein n=1 Tax=Rhodnius prolixus TaxID=13249 RepID=T1IEP5_RHOPR